MVRFGPVAIMRVVPVALSVAVVMFVGVTAHAAEPTPVPSTTTALDPLAASGVTALALALALLSLFIRGDVVPRSVLDMQIEANAQLRKVVSDLTEAMAERTKMDRERLDWEKEQSRGRGARREEERR